MSEYAMMMYLRRRCAETLLVWRALVRLQVKGMQSYFTGLEHFQTLTLMRSMIQWSLFCTADQQERQSNFKATLYRDMNSLAAGYRRWKDFYIEQMIEAASLDMCFTQRPSSCLPCQFLPRQLADRMSLALWWANPA